MRLKVRRREGDEAGGMKAGRKETEDMIYYAHKNSAFVIPSLFYMWSLLNSTPARVLGRTLCVCECICSFLHSKRCVYVHLFAYRWNVPLLLSVCDQIFICRFLADRSTLLSLGSASTFHRSPAYQQVFRTNQKMVTHPYSTHTQYYNPTLSWRAKRVQSAR